MTSRPQWIFVQQKEMTVVQQNHDNNWCLQNILWYGMRSSLLPENTYCHILSYRKHIVKRGFACYPAWRRPPGRAGCCPLSGLCEWCGSHGGRWGPAESVCTQLWFAALSKASPVLHKDGGENTLTLGKHPSWLIERKWTRLYFCILKH